MLEDDVLSPRDPPRPFYCTEGDERLEKTLANAAGTGPAPQIRFAMVCRGAPMGEGGQSTMCHFKRRNLGSKSRPDGEGTKGVSASPFHGADAPHPIRRSPCRPGRQGTPVQGLLGETADPTIHLGLKGCYGGSRSKRRSRGQDRFMRRPLRRQDKGRRWH